MISENVLIPFLSLRFQILKIKQTYLGYCRK